MTAITRIFPSLVDITIACIEKNSIATTQLPVEILEKLIARILSHRDDSIQKLQILKSDKITDLDCSGQPGLHPVHIHMIAENFPALRTLNLSFCKLVTFLPKTVAKLQDLEELDLRGSGNPDTFGSHVPMHEIAKLIADTREEESITYQRKRARVLVQDPFGRGVLGRMVKEQFPLKNLQDAILSGSYSLHDIRDQVYSCCSGVNRAVQLVALVIEQTNFDINGPLSNDKTDTMVGWALGRGNIGLLNQLLGQKRFEVNKVSSQLKTPLDELETRAKQELKPDVYEHMHKLLREKGAMTYKELQAQPKRQNPEADTDHQEKRRRTIDTSQLT